MKWSTITVGRQLGVSDTMVRHYLRGKRNPSLITMRRIEQHYGWPLMEQIRCLPDVGYDRRYGEEFTWWLNHHHEEGEATHVPNRHVARYRHLKTIADSFAHAGDLLGSEFAADAEQAHALAGTYRALAQELCEKPAFVHNHPTRRPKPPGVCPACDQARVEKP